MGSGTKAFVELDECISIYLMSSFFFFFSFGIHDQNNCHLDFSSELSYIFHTYAMSLCAPIWAVNS